MVEVELRGLLDKADYSRVLQYLGSRATNKRQDDKIAWYYVFNGGIFKLVDEISRNRAKLSLKIGDESSGRGMEEVEFFLDRNGLESCSVMLDRLGFTVKSTVNQRRINFSYKGVELAIKHTPDWGYHFEAEVVVDKPDQVLAARERIKAVCEELNMRPMSTEELRSFLSTL